MDRCGHLFRSEDHGRVMDAIPREFGASVPAALARSLTIRWRFSRGGMIP